MSLNVITRGNLNAAAMMDNRRVRQWRAIAPLLRFERFANFGGKLFDVERFGQEKRSRLAAITRLERFLEVAGYKQNLDVRLRKSKRIAITPAADLRHYHVGKKKVDFASAVFGKQTLRVGAVCGFDDLVTQCAQQSHRDVPDAPVIFHN